jgi:DNA-binding IclR family transcriptional regulator
MIATETPDFLLHRIRGEFGEMPGLRLTSTQAARLWHLDMMTVTTLLATLVDAKFLYRTPTGAYKRVESS